MRRLFWVSMAALFIVISSVLPSPSARAASITVTDTADSFGGSTCSLRNAIESVNDGANFGGCSFDETEAFGTNDTITLTGQNYVLSIGGTGVDDQDNSAGDLDVFVSLTIQGAGSSQTQISANYTSGSPDRVLEILSQTSGGGGFTFAMTVNLNGLTVQNGSTLTTGASGGGIAMGFSGLLANLDDVLVTGNRTEGVGGGIYNNGAFLVVDNSTLLLNEAGIGGGISNGGILIVQNSTLNNNTAVINLNNNTAAGIGGGAGGGIYSSGDGFMLINTTISGNITGSFGGGIYADRFFRSAGEIPETATGLLFNVTVAENQAGSIGGGICLDCQPQLQTAELQGQGESGYVIANTLIAQNTAQTSPDCTGQFLSLGFNLIGDDELCGGFDQQGDQVNVPAGIEPLAPNGGLTQTHALQIDSTAVDAGNNVEGCRAPNVQSLIATGDITEEDLTTDQRGFLRPVAVLDPANPICDIGAFEFQTFDFNVTKDDGLDGQPIAVGDNFTYTISVTNPGPGEAETVTVTDPLPATLTFVSATPSQGTCSQAAGTVTCDLGSLAEGATATVEIVVTATSAGTLTNVVTVTGNGDGDVTVTKTATATTVVQGGNLLLFGNGCAMTPLGASPAGMIAMAFAMFAAWRGFRRRF